LHRGRERELAAAAIDVAEPQRKPDEFLFVDVQGQPRGQQNAERRGDRGDERLVLGSPGDRDVEDAFAAGLPENILK